VPLTDKKMQRESKSVREIQAKPKYEAPQVKVMTEQEVLSAFQVTAAGTSMWWV
jgi:hypothetical protein